ncbi:MAG: hypothetical protein K6G31_00700 [Paludibacteraceae bacterium]|nr:hypothetical protein [Paludibacteraceae bacterium]
MSEEQVKIESNAQPEEPKKTEVKPEKKKGGFSFAKLGCFTFIVLLLIGAVFCYFRYYYVIADGVKAGNLNYITRKGYVFKTFEGRLIQEGIKSGNTTGTIQNNEFIFSVSDDRLFKIMETMTNQQLQLHYNEYLNSLPWRGYSEFVVDSIISVNNIPFKEYMEKYHLNGAMPPQVNNSNNAIGTVNRNNNEQQTVTMDEAVRQLQQAQEQLNKAQQQLERLQQQNANNGANNNAGNNSQRRYQSPENNNNQNFNNNRTDDGNVFNQ